MVFTHKRGRPSCTREFKEILSDPSELIIGLIVADGFIMPHVKLGDRDRTLLKYLEIG